MSASFKKVAATFVVAALAFIACQKEYSIENNTGFNSTGAWEFKDSTNTLFVGDPVEYYIDDSTDPSSAHMVYSGATASLGATFSIEIFYPTGTATTGTFSSAAGQVNFIYRNNNGRFYRVDAFSGQTSTENISVSISAITDSSVTGTFSGTALDSSSRLVIIKEGKFTYKRRSVAPPLASAGSLGSAADSCTGALLNGTYRRGVAMTAANSVSVTANVTNAGTYTIYSDTIKGIYFYGTGTFPITGIQAVTIPALGTPTDTGTATFRIRYGSSFCKFKVRIDSGGIVVVPPPTGDYFPTTANSNWSYDIYNAAGTTLLDTLMLRSTGTTLPMAGSTFNIFIDSDGDSAFYRKGSGLYYQAEDLDALIGTGGQQQTIILKDNVPSGTSWADSFNVSYFGVPAKVKMTYTITAKAVTATVGGLSYQDVIKVNAVYTMQVTGLPITTPVANFETWYARGTGMIYQRFTDNTVTPPVTTDTRLRRAQIF